MFLLYESYYGEIILDCGESTNIIGLYSTKEKAIEKAKSIINEDIKANNYVLDSESNLEKDNYALMFFDSQENWNCYFEICIKEIELDKESD